MQFLEFPMPHLGRPRNLVPDGPSTMLPYHFAQQVVVGKKELFLLQAPGQF